ncbi:hypothetical protein A5757_19915 [Mycobacterium sp. 852013-51886_SCH5428379]|uniref:PPE domain-containing protein n=1 Tax=Mycobacterium sp. 852013-51886_SCH5428379 TaxID=1834111 RepID=UPI0007FE1255|nr:PPE domain-containing protein [Mycobacterium sp. 852013-51886_SCH5428379]OBB57684.1 hypothetical protein A5757_19915 [Mycobacterium sp. 852013-51886_SCH5428379]
MTEQRVDPQTLRTQADAMTFPFVKLQSEAQRPDRLTATIAAVENLNKNAAALSQYWSYAETENANIMGSLRSAADAYQNVDEEYGVAIDNPDRAAAVGRITIPDNSVPLPAVPDDPAFGAVAPGSYADVETTQQLLAEGDDGASLQLLAVNFGIMADHLDARSGLPNTTDWEGEAADAALKRHNTFNAWLEDLSKAYRELAHSAEKIREAHLAAKAAHQTIYEQYMTKKQQLATAYRQRSAGDPVIQQLQNDMQQLQQQSDDLREGYAAGADITPSMPGRPDSAAPSGPSSVGGGGGGGGAPSGGMPNPSDFGRQGGSPAVSPASAGGQGGGAPSGGGSPGGGSPAGGGSPGGGSPAGGGAPGGGLPGEIPGAGDEGLPPLPDDPGLTPAAAGGGGAGGGAGGGGAGAGGIPAGPLQPAVGADSVAPVATGGARGGNAGGPAGAGAGVGGMGMGGMPMGGAGAGRGGGQDRKRTPGLSPDEDLYVEDRPFTEAIIGRQPRKGPQDNKDSK